MAELEITKDEALAAVRAAAWPKGQIATCGHRGCEEHVEDGPLYIHVLSGFGMDMPLESVEEEIRSARKAYWVDQDTAPWAWAMRHQLAAETADGRVHFYAVRRPEVVPSPEVMLTAKGKAVLGTFEEPGVSDGVRA